MKSSQLTVDQLFTDFFARMRAQHSGVRLARVHRVEAALRQCAEADGARILIARDPQILEAEKQFAPEGAFARIAHGDDLIFVLAMFVESKRLLDDVEDRRMQLRAAEGLARYAVARCELDPGQLSCPLLDINYRVVAARRGIAAVRRDSRARSA